MREVCATFLRCGEVDVGVSWRWPDGSQGSCAAKRKPRRRAARMGLKVQYRPNFELETRFYRERSIAPCLSVHTVPLNLQCTCRGRVRKTKRVSSRPFRRPLTVVTSSQRTAGQHSSVNELSARRTTAVCRPAGGQSQKTRPCLSLRVRGLLLRQWLGLGALLQHSKGCIYGASTSHMPRSVRLKP